MHHVDIAMAAQPQTDREIAYIIHHRQTVDSSTSRAIIVVLLGPPVTVELIDPTSSCALSVFLFPLELTILHHVRDATQDIESQQKTCDKPKWIHDPVPSSSYITITLASNLTIVMHDLLRHAPPVDAR
jgi:hypothetical protein